MASTIYDSEAKLTIGEFVKGAMVKTSFFVPDLQRPYVWTPTQIVMLLDSVFKGWPVGSLLTWQVKPDYDESGNQINQIPYRTFYTFVSRVKSVPPETASERDRPSPREGDTMILDGQQRLQSLLVAFGGGKGLCLKDAEWKADLMPEKKGSKPNKEYHTRASLYLDVGKYMEELHAHGGVCDRIDLHRVLAWVAPNKGDYSQPRKKGWETSVVIPCLGGTDRFYLQLSDIWDVAERGAQFGTAVDQWAAFFENGLMKNKFSVVQLARIYNAFGGADVVCKSLAQLAMRLSDISGVAIRCLKIKLFQSPYQGVDQVRYNADLDAYNDAIVNIFTRLNTAGRTLTREEITYAWLKQGWHRSSLYPNAEEFVDSIRDEFAEWEKIDDDMVIRSLAYAWSAHAKDGVAIRERDLLDGYKIKPMAGFVADNTIKIKTAAEALKDDIDSEDLDDVFDSVSPILSAWNFYIVAETFIGFCEARVVMNAMQKDSLRASVNAVRRRFLGRWFAITTWSQRWQQSSGEYFEQLILKMAESIRTVNAGEISPEKVVDSVAQLGSELVATVAALARERLDNNVTDRGRVSNYKTRLIVWQRLTERRSQYRNLTFKTSARKAPQLQVDHIVSYAGWMSFVDTKINAGELSITDAVDIFMEGEAEERKAGVLADARPDAEKIRDLASAFINGIGNCSILNQTYNKFKDKNELNEILDMMGEFRVGADGSPAVVDRGDWCSEMLLSDVFVRPFSGGHTVREIAQAIRARGQRILHDLEQFVLDTPGYDVIR